MTPKQQRFYVYRLIDPRDDQAFYVGKGTGRRAYAHATAVKRGRFDNGAKCQRISEILRSGHEVRVEYVAIGMAEQEAFALERRMIASGDALTNMLGGIVSEAEARAARIAMNIAAIKPYDVWMASASEGTIALVRRVWGEPEEFYRWYRDAWNRVARDPQTIAIPA